MNICKIKFISFYIILPLLISGCASFFSSSDKSSALAFYPSTFISVIGASAVYYDLKGEFPRDPSEFSAFIDSVKTLPKGAGFSFIDADSSCLKARIYPAGDSLNFDSYFEIMKHDTNYIYALYLNNFMAKLDAISLNYNDYSMKGDFSVKKDLTGTILVISGTTNVESGFKSSSSSE